VGDDEGDACIAYADRVPCEGKAHRLARGRGPRDGVLAVLLLTP